MKAGLDAADAAALERLIKSMFPRYHASRKNLQFTYESTKPWTKDRLVCSPAYGPRYFAYAIGSSDVSDRDFDGILASASSNSQDLRALLDSQLTQLKQSMLIFKIVERSKSLSEKAAANIALCLATLSDRFEEPFSLQDLNHPGIKAAELAADLCGRSEAASARANLCAAVLSNSKEMWFAAAFMRDVDPAHVNAGRRPLLDGEELKRVREQFLERYRSYARDARQLDLQRRWRFETLYSVARASSKRQVHDQFVPAMEADLSIAVLFLQLLTQPVSRTGEIVPRPGDLDPGDLDSADLLVDLNTMAEIIERKWGGRAIVNGQSADGKVSSDDKILSQFLEYHQARRLLRKE